MTQNEKRLFIELCTFREPRYEEIGRLVAKGAATCSVLGLLFANRMAAVAHDVLCRGGLMDKTDREFRNSLRGAALVNRMQNQTYRLCLEQVTSVLDTCNVPYALLKGAFLCEQYPEGGRTSNDVDVLLASEHVGEVTETLRAHGFTAGYVKGGTFTPATRRQLIESRMIRGETVPLVRPTDSPVLPYLEIDLNFSLDYKRGDDTALRAMLSRTVRANVGGTSIRTLDPHDFLLQLCFHLYKEATTMPWIRMKRDMTFYKYCDIYALLYDVTDAQAAALIRRAEQLRAETELAYCLYAVHAFFGLRQPTLREYAAERGERNALIVAPAEGKTYRYTEPDPTVRFFKPDRAALLEEVKP